MTSSRHLSHIGHHIDHHHINQPPSVITFTDMKIQQPSASIK
jgi:hypothetical protein